MKKVMRHRAVSSFGFFLKTLPRNIMNSFLGWNAIWHGVAIGLTATIVLSGFDWWYFVNTRMINYAFFFPAVVLGAFIPILVPIGMLVVGHKRKNDAIKKLGFMLGQAAIIGSIISSLYKAFTGRIPPVGNDLLLDVSREFNFGFLENGIFWGWPSSHTTIAFAMVVALITLFPKNTRLKVATLFYAFYIGLGISVSIHWFSDFAAGAIMGSIIGVVVGKTFEKMQS